MTFYVLTFPLKVSISLQIGHHQNPWPTAQSLMLKLWKCLEAEKNTFSLTSAEDQPKVK